MGYAAAREAVRVERAKRVNFMVSNVLQRGSQRGLKEIDEYLFKLKRAW
jgi:hypothetical protein